MKAAQRHRLKASQKGAVATARPKGGGAVRTVTWRDKARYKTDEVLSRGTLGIVLWLAAMTLLVVVIAGAVLAIFALRFNEGTDEGFFEAAWQSMLRAIDPGTMGGDTGWARVVALLVTLAGIFLASALIGIIATGLDSKIDDLRKGRSFVVERGHTAILGWSPRIFIVISEITVANENHPGLAIVVLADREKTEMEDEIRTRVPNLRKSKLVVRSGDPSTPSDLGIVNIDEARSVVVLGDDDGDAEVVKTVLALAARDTAIGRANVVAEVSDPRTARALEASFGDDVLTVQSTEVVARVTAQSCRQAGLSTVVQELLDFDGDEIYFEDAAALVGHTFGESLNAYETSTIIGRRAADGTITVCPPMDTVFGAGDQVIAVSEDDDTVVFGAFTTVEPIAHADAGQVVIDEERILIVGWNSLGEKILRELDQFVAPGSKADILTDAALARPLDREIAGLTNIDVAVTASDDEADELPRLAATVLYSSVIILSYKHQLSAPDADARSLLAMLLIQRGLADAGDDREPRVIVELLDAKAAELAVVSGADDFVVSDALASLMMSQLSEHPDLAEVFRQIYTAEGSSLHMETAEAFVGKGELTFAQVVATTATHGRLAIGWRRVVDGDAEVVVNPLKSRPVSFGPEDHIVVIG
jgi:hypothetical protein